MKYGVILAVTAFLVSPVLADDQLDKKVVEIVKQTGALYKNAKTMHAEGTIATTVDTNGQKRTFPRGGH